MEIWKYMAQPHRPQLTIQYGAEKVRFACRITKARAQTHAQYLVLLFFRGSSGYANAPRCYVLRAYIACRV